MPRPKKTTPTVATTEPDTNLNPDRAQVAAVADLPHEPRIVVSTIPESAPVTVAHVEQVLPSGAKVPSREWVDQCEAKLAEQDAALQAIARVVGMASAGDLAEMVARVRTIAEQSARIVELEAELGAYRTAPASPPISDPATWPRFIPSPGQVPGAPGLVGSSHDYTTWDGSDESMAAYRDSLPEDERDRMDAVALHQGNFGPDDVKRAWRAAIAQRDPGRVIAARDARISNLESTIVENQSILNRIGRDLIAAQGPRPLTPHEIAHGYLAIVSGNVRAARWKRNILHDIRDPDMVIGQVDHLTDGWAPSVKGAAAPPMKTEAEARAWCEARCGWTVVA